MNLKKIGREYSFLIFSDGINYFIPGNKNTAFSPKFEKLSMEDYLNNDFSLGSGWMFDKKGINELKRMFEEQEVPYREIAFSK